MFPLPLCLCLFQFHSLSSIENPLSFLLLFFPAHLHLRHTAVNPPHCFPLVVFPTSTEIASCGRHKSLSPFSLHPLASFSASVSRFTNLAHVLKLSVNYSTIRRDDLADSGPARRNHNYDHELRLCLFTWAHLFTIVRRLRRRQRAFPRETCTIRIDAQASLYTKYLRSSPPISILAAHSTSLTRTQS